MTIPRPSTLSFVAWSCFFFGAFKFCSFLFICNQPNNSNFCTAIEIQKPAIPKKSHVIDTFTKGTVISSKILCIRMIQIEEYHFTKNKNKNWRIQHWVQSVPHLAYEMQLNDIIPTNGIIFIILLNGPKMVLYSSINGKWL